MEQNLNPYGIPIKKKNSFETAAMVLSVMALASVTFIYDAYIFGALSILFALLSRGEQMKMSSKSKSGLIFSVVAIVLSTVITIGSFAIVLNEYDNIEDFINEYSEITGYDYEELMNTYD